MNKVVNALNSAADKILRREFGLTFSQFEFLAGLESRGTIPSKSLAEELGVSGPAISKRISWFIQRGLLRTGLDSLDRRVVTLSITSLGKKVVRNASDVLETKFREGFGRIHEVDLDSLNSTLLLVLQHLTVSREEKRMAS